MKNGVLGSLLWLPLVAFCVLRVTACVRYDQECGGHIKRAADANTVEIAEREMATVVGYLESRGMTEGYTSILWRTPDEDVGFWYRNLRASLDELRTVGPEATQLERSNVLMKLRETLLDHGDNGTKVTDPSGISVFPRNTAYAVGGLIAAILAAIGCVFLWRAIDQY